jgi:site-specific DNA recombinase
MKIVGYVRVSTAGQEDNTSLEAQKERLKSYAIAMGYELVQIHEEVGSGKSADTRPEFQKAITMLRSGEADGLIVCKLDRLGRNVRDILKLVDEVIQPLGKNLMIIDSQIDTSNATGRMILTVLAAMAEMERGLINERTQGGRRSKAADGGYAYGSPQFGQQSIGKELAEHPEEQAAIEIIRKHRRAGKSPYAIADYLNTQGIPSKRGGIWHHSAVRNVLKRLKTA